MTPTPMLPSTVTPNPYHDLPWTWVGAWAYARRGAWRLTCWEPEVLKAYPLDDEINRGADGALVLESHQGSTNIRLFHNHDGERHTYVVSCGQRLSFTWTTTLDAVRAMRAWEETLQRHPYTDTIAFANKPVRMARKAALEEQGIIPARRDAYDPWEYCHFPPVLNEPNSAARRELDKHVRRHGAP